ncbi:MAG TPA: S8 family serine peptidase [Terriglobia bacterium]|nr:S8 family serine peptidase [Terriglobia bacterium]
MFRRVLLCGLIILAIAGNAMAASNPMILQTGPLVSVVSVINALGGGTLLDQVPGTTIYLVDLPNLPIVTPLLESLLGVVFVEPDRTILTPNRGEMGVLSVGTTTAVDWYKMQPELVRINAISAQSYSRGKGIVIADLNSLIDYSHPALAGHLTGGYDFVSARSGYQATLNQSSATFLDQSSATFLDQSSATFLDQSSATFLDQSSATFLDQSQLTTIDANPAYGHGTLCAGVIAAMAPDSLIMPLRVFDDSGQTDVFSVTKAIYYAVTHGARVVNMSFGMSQSYNSIQAALTKASNAGIVVVASAGNDNTSTPQFPASVSSLISVASVASTDVKASFSNYGSTVYVDAPGVNIISAYPGARYAMVSGTSFSAPMVAAEAALIMAVKTTSPKSVIGSAVVSVSTENPSYIGMLGHGRINVLGAVK